MAARQTWANVIAGYVDCRYEQNLETLLVCYGEPPPSAR